MPEQNNQIPDVLKKMKESLDRSVSVEETISHIQQIGPILQQIEISTITKIDLLLYEYLKPISREATSAKIIDKNAKHAIQNVILTILCLYAKAIRFSFSHAAFENITELLQRHTQIFRKINCGASAMEQEESQTNNQQQQKIQPNDHIKVSQFHNETPFFYRCCSEVMQILDGIEGIFSLTNMNFIKEYLTFLYYMEDYLKIKFVAELCEKAIVAIEAAINDQSCKEFQKDITYDSCSSLMNIGIKVLSKTGELELRKKYQLIGSLYGLNLLRNSTSIQRKIQGLKNINQWAHHFYANPATYNKEEDYCRWMFENGVIKIIYDDPTQLSVVKATGQIIKLFVRKKCLGEENFLKIFDFIDKATPQVRQLVFKYIDHASTRFHYEDYELIINKFVNQQTGSYLEEQAFNLLQSVGRYATYTQNSRIQAYLREIIKKGQFKNSLIESKCVELYITTFGRVLDRNRQAQKKINDFFDFVQPYIADASSLGVVLIKKAINKLPQMGILSRSKGCFNLVMERNIIELGIKWLDEIKPKSDVEDLISVVLQNAKQYYYQKAKINQQLYFKATKSPKIFQKLISFLDNSRKIEDMFHKMVSMFVVEKYPFICLKILFFRLNQTNVAEILDAENQFDLRVAVASLKGFQNLKYLLLNASDLQTRIEVAEFIAELYTMYSDDIVNEGQQQLKKAMKQLMYMTLSQFNKEESPGRLLSYLYQMEQFMQATQLFGVGDLKSHNSLVPTSTVTVKIFNELTYGSDVLKVYEKNVPSNLTLFQVIEELSRQFKCSPSEIMFREGTQMWPQRLNGLTLEEVKIDGKIINAVKSFRNKIRKEPLIADGQLTEKARKVFEEIYNVFAVDGKMGKKQCANYVAGVTKTSCSLGDPRVSQFFRDYDQDKDDNITPEDFLKFYKVNASSYRDDIVWKNLNIMRYRKDLKKYDQPIEKPPLQLMFRYHLSQNPQIYEMLFRLTESTQDAIRQKAMALLFRLPTYNKTLESFSSNLNLQDKNSFNTEYLLIAIQSYLSSSEEKQTRLKKFIESGNSNEIYSMMIRISQMKNPSHDDKKCLFISLQILRLLIYIPNLRTNINSDFQYMETLKLPQTDLFISIAQQSLKNADGQILQSSLALQFTQQQTNLEFVIASIFHNQFEIRKIACNYVFVASKLSKVSINLFAIEPSKNCQYWFQILVKIISITPSLNFKSIVDYNLNKLSSMSENIEINPDDSIIYGHLSILFAIFSVYDVAKPDNLMEQIVSLEKRLISNRNRRMIYALMRLQNPNFAIQYVSTLLKSVQHSKEVTIKKNFVGIKNLGAICYMNSILQQLFAVGEFRKIIFELRNDDIEQTQVDSKLIYDDVLYQLQKLYTFLQTSKRQYYNPQQFCLTIKDSNKKPINIRIQEDAHEFVGSFMDRLEPYLKKNNKFDEFNGIFGGKTLTQFTCQGCSNKIQRDQSFIQLSLEVKNMKELKESFGKFIQPEAIDDYFCEVEDKVQRITKQTFVSSLPKILIINLQRIIFDLDTFQKVKVDNSFLFYHQLNLFQYVNNKNIKKQDCQYELKGIVIHSGTSESGHYYSIIKEGKQWFKFNDQTVSKFDPKDIPRQAFGGSDTTDQWNDELKFSTNAYILFYEKKEEMKAQLTMEMNEKFVKQIEEDNEILYKQVQVHQESIFEFVNSMYEGVRPEGIDDWIKVKTFAEDWQQSENLSNYQKIYALMIEIMNFAKTFYDIKGDHLIKLGRYLYEFFYLLPEQSYKFLMELNPEQCLDSLALINDDYNRNIYRCLLNKILHVYNEYYGLDLEEQSNESNKIKNLLDVLFNFLQDQRLSKNIFKSTQYFQFWKANCEFIPPIYNYLNKKQILVHLVDVLMANDSPLLQKGVKKQQVPQYQAIPIIQFIVLLMSRKKNLQDYINPAAMVKGLTYETLTQKEKKMIGNIKFYRKMIKNRNDNGLLEAVTSKLCEKDQQFSKKMVEMFIKGLNSSFDEPESSLILINHLKYYLLIDDELTLNRIKWVMGIPQMIISEEMNYGLRYTDDSTVFSYVSPLYFIQSDQYQPALQILFMKRSLYTQFSIAGVTLLLQLLISSDNFFNYLMSLPAPNYLCRHYADWIDEYIKKLKQEESYYFQFDKNVCYNKLYNLYNQFEQKLAKMNPKRPVNSLIIGKNKNLQMKASLGTADYEMALWAHETFTLRNQPEGISNKSLPKHLFKFAQPQGYAVNFVSLSKKIAEDDEQSEIKWSYMTLQIDSKKKFKIIINLKNFKEEIYIEKSQIRVNFPFDDYEGLLSDYIQVVEIEEENNKNAVEEMKEQQYPSLLDQNYGPANYSMNNEYIGEKECSACTFINFGRDRCQVCDNPLQ